MSNQNTLELAGASLELLVAEFCEFCEADALYIFTGPPMPPATCTQRKKTFLKPDPIWMM